MKKAFLKLSKNSFFYLVANFISVFLGLILLPLYTSFLTPDEYGIIVITVSVTTFFSAFYVLGLTESFRRFYFDYQEETDKKELKKFISTIILFVFIYGLIFTFFIVYCKDIVENYVKDITFFPYIIIAILSAYFMVFFQIRLAMCQVEQKAKSYTFLFVSLIFLQNFLIIYSVVFQNQGALGYVSAILISNIIFAGVSFWTLKSFLIPTIDIAQLKISLRYGLPLVPCLFASWMLISADKLILNNLVSTYEVGLYSIGHKIGIGMNLLVASINLAWLPYFFMTMKGKNDSAKKEAARLVTYWVIVMCVVFLLFSIFSKEVISIFASPQYYLAYKVIPLIALAYLFGGFCSIAMGPLLWKGKTFIISVATVTSGILSVVLNFLLIPKFQMTGAALTMVLSFVYYFSFTFYFSLKILPLSYEYYRLFKIFTVTALCYLITFFFLETNNFWLSVLLKLYIIIMFPIFLYLLSFWREEEKNVIRNILRYRKRYMANIFS